MGPHYKEHFQNKQWMRESNYLPVLINRMVRMEGLPNPNGNGPPANVVAPMQLLESVALILPHFAYARGRPPILARDHNNTGSLLTFSSSQMPRVGPVCISPTQQPAFRWNLDPRWRVLRCPTVSIALCTWDSIYSFPWESRSSVRIQKFRIWAKLGQVGHDANSPVSFWASRMQVKARVRTCGL